MKPRTYSILSDAVEEGARLGVKRAYKHNDAPTDEQIAGNVANAIMLCITERFSFDDNEL